MVVVTAHDDASEQGGSGDPAETDPAVVPEDASDGDGAEAPVDASDHDSPSDDAEPGEDDETPGAAGVPVRSRRLVPARVVTTLVALAVVTGIVAVAVLVWTFTTRSWEVGGVEVAGDQVSQQQEREELMSIGRQFMLRSGTYGPDGLDDENRLSDYRESVGELITPSFGNTFETDAGIAEQLVAQAQVSRSAEVFGTGVSELDDDRAVVLVAGAITDSYPQQGDEQAQEEAQEEAQAQEPFPFRVEVQMVRVDGEWLVDDFAGVQRPDAQQPEEPGIDPDLPVPEEDDGSGGQDGEDQGGQGQGGQGQDGGGQGGDQ